MTFLKRNINLIFVCVLEALVGVLLLINPDKFFLWIFIACGIALLIAGVVSVVGYFRADPITASLKASMVKGLAMLTGGAFLVFRASWVSDRAPTIIMLLFGIAVLIGGMFKFQWFIDAIRLKTGRWLFYMVDSLISLACAIIILANPFTTTVVLWTFIAVSLIVESVLDIVVMIAAGSAPSRDEQ